MSREWMTLGFPCLFAELIFFRFRAISEFTFCFVKNSFYCLIHPHFCHLIWATNVSRKVIPKVLLNFRNWKTIRVDNKCFISKRNILFIYLIHYLILDYLTQAWDEHLPWNQQNHISKHTSATNWQKFRPLRGKWNQSVHLYTWWIVMGLEHGLHLDPGFLYLICEWIYLLLLLEVSCSTRVNE